MKNSILIEGHSCRWYFAGKCWVSEDGKYAYYTKKKGIKESAKITTTNSGKFFNCCWTGTISMAQAVIACFCHPMPQDGKRYVIGYKDKNCQNCHKNNLEWVEYHYAQSNSNYVKLSCEGTTVTVNKNGCLKMGSNTLQVINEMWDADTDAGQSWRPYVNVKGKIHYIEDLMEDAGFIQGDDAPFKAPVILHRDNNWMNFDSCNLEWVDQSDPRWNAYENQALKEMNALTQKINKNGRFPDSYIKSKLPKRFKGWGV